MLFLASAPTFASVAFFLGIVVIGSVCIYNACFSCVEICLSRVLVLAGEFGLASLARGALGSFGSLGALFGNA